MRSGERRANPGLPLCLLLRRPRPHRLPLRPPPRRAFPCHGRGSRGPRSRDTRPRRRPCPPWRRGIA
ncbi:MAG TPA: hypothetical protein DCM68_08665 [Verrucomicrobia bacterium]|nr:hypothetical protein [Verrucomicrobiota bacterium]